MKVTRKDYGRDQFVKTVKKMRSGGSVKIGWTDPEQAQKIYQNHEKWPVLSVTYKVGRQKFAKITRQGLRDIFRGKKSRKEVYQLIGDTIREDLKVTILSISQPRNSAATIAKKGFDMPLVEYGDLIGSIEVVIDD